MSQPECAHKVTLSSGKTVLLRDFKIKHQEMAVQACARKAGDNPLILGSLMQSELVKILVAKINDKDVKPIEMENLDNVFTFQEFAQVTQVITKLMGTGDGDFLEKCQIEVVTSGNK